MTPASIAPIAPVAVRACTATCACGTGLDALAQALTANRSALRRNDLPGLALDTAIGRVDGLESMSWDEPAWDSRVTRLARLSLQAEGFADAVAAACARHGAARVGLVLGTSASTIAVTEAAYRSLTPEADFPPALRHPALNTPHAVADFAQRLLALQGPALTVSTACSSGAKALAVAERWLRLGVADAVVAGGIDALSGSLLHGFASLQVLDARPCRPFHASRQGISIGEGAAWLLLERGPGDVELRGWGESVDAHHMSSPHPQGLG
ncbi:MAG: beta-ketoacyl synthase N-terminal-like domain-containing protein, partial [Rubrivivax sp.]